MEKRFCYNMEIWKLTKFLSNRLTNKTKTVYKQLWETIYHYLWKTNFVGVICEVRIFMWSSSTSKEYSYLRPTTFNIITFVMVVSHPIKCTWKQIDKGASPYFFGGLKFFIFLSFWVWKSLSYFFGSKDFSFIFGGNHIKLLPFDTIYFLGVRLNDLDLPNRSLKSDQILEGKTLTSNSQKRMDPLMNGDRSTPPNDSSPDSWNLLRKWMKESLDDCTTGLFFGSVTFMNLFFWVWSFLVFIFLGIPKNAWA